MFWLLYQDNHLCDDDIHIQYPSYWFLRDLPCILSCNIFYFTENKNYYEQTNDDLIIEFGTGGAIGLGRQPNAYTSQKYDVSKFNYFQFQGEVKASYNQNYGKEIRVYKVTDDYDIFTPDNPSSSDLICTIYPSAYDTDTKYDISNVDYILIRASVYGEDTNSGIWREIKATIKFGR